MRGQKYDSEPRSIVVDSLIQVKKSGIKKTLTDDVDSIELSKLILIDNNQYGYGYSKLVDI